MLYLKKTLLIVILYSFANICVAKSKIIPIVLIGERTEAGDIYLNYKNIFGDFVKIKFNYDYAKNLDTVSLFIEHSTLLEFNAHMQQYPVYVEPGDTIFISTKAHGSYYEFKAKGCLQYRINFFNFLLESNCGMGYPDFFNRVFKASNYEGSLAFANDNYDKRMTLLREYRKKYCLDDEFYSFMEAMIKEYYVQALLTPYLRPIAETRYDMLPEKYLKLVYKSPLHKLLKQSERVRFASHRGILVSYIKFLDKDYLDTSKELPSLYRIAVDSLDGESRDYLLFFLMKNNIKKGGEDVDKLYKTFHLDCASQKFKDYIDSLHTKVNGIVSESTVLKTQLEDTTGKKMTWEVILKQNKGKVLYIDFWASWCGPCLAQMPFSKKLESELSGKPVAFIYLSIDASKSEWLHSIQTHTLSEFGTQHYLLSDEAALATYLGVPPIPHYLIIDRAGKPVFLDATRPDELSTLKELLRLSQ